MKKSTRRPNSSRILDPYSTVLASTSTQLCFFTPARRKSTQWVRGLLRTSTGRPGPRRPRARAKRKPPYQYTVQFTVIFIHRNSDVPTDHPARPRGLGQSVPTYHPGLGVPFLALATTRNPPTMMDLDGDLAGVLDVVLIPSASSREELFIDRAYFSSLEPSRRLFSSHGNCSTQPSETVVRGGGRAVGSRGRRVPFANQDGVLKKYWFELHFNDRPFRKTNASRR